MVPKAGRPHRVRKTFNWSREMHRNAPFPSMRRVDRLQDLQCGRGSPLLERSAGPAPVQRPSEQPRQLSHVGGPPDKPIVEVQQVDHESRVHLDIETDDIPAEVARLEKLGAKVVKRMERWVVMQGRPTNASASYRCSVPASRRMPIPGTKYGLRDLRNSFSRVPSAIPTGASTRLGFDSSERAANAR